MEWQVSANMGEYSMYLKDQTYMNTLASCGSFTAAASQLGISQPALSKWLTNLESELGVTLVIRHKKGIVLTEAGQIYLDGCQAAISATKETLEKISRLHQTEHSSDIILGASPIRGADCFASIYAPFKKHFPDVPLMFSSGTASELRNMVSLGKVSLAIIGADSTDAAEIEYMKFMDEELLFMVPRESRLGYTAESSDTIPFIDMSSIGDFPLLLTRDGTSHTAVTSEIYEKYGLTGNIVFRNDILPLLYKLVKTGIGAAFIPSAYYDPADPVSVYRYSPRIIVYQGIGIRPDRRLTPAEEFLIHLIISHWRAPQYMHQYTDYYLNQRRMRLGAL